MKVARKKREDRNVVKARILEYARNAFSVYGIKDVTMDSIASGISISKRTLYEVFKDKEELLLEIIKIHSYETREFISQISKEYDTVLDIIFRLYERNVQDIKKINRLFFEELHKYQSVTDYFQYARDEMASVTIYCFNKGIQQGLFRSDVNYEIIRVAMVEEMDMLLTSKLNEKYTLVEIYENLVAMHMRGVSTEKGLKMVDEFFDRMKKERDNSDNSNNNK